MDLMSVLQSQKICHFCRLQLEDSGSQGLGVCTFIPPLCVMLIKLPAVIIQSNTIQT